MDRTEGPGCGERHLLGAGQRIGPVDAERHRRKRPEQQRLFEIGPARDLWRDPGAAREIERHHVHRPRRRGLGQPLGHLGGRGHEAAVAPAAGDIARLQLQHREIGADKIVKPDEGKPVEIGVEAVGEERQSTRRQRHRPRDLGREPGQRQRKTGAEEEAVEVALAAVRKAHAAAGDGRDPGTHRDPALGDGGQEALALGDAGHEDIGIGGKGAILLGRARGLQDLRLERRRGRSGPARALEGGGAGEEHMLGRHPGDQLRQHVALAPRTERHPRPGLCQRRRDLERADRTAGDQHRGVAIARHAAELARMAGAELAREGLEPRHLRDRAAQVAARGDDDAVETLGPGLAAAARADLPPAGFSPSQLFDPGAEADRGAQAEPVAVAVKIAVHVLPARVGRRARRMIEIGKRRHHPAGVGDHAGPGGAVEPVRVPLPAKIARSLEQGGREAARPEPARGDKPGGPGADDCDRGAGCGRMGHLSLR
ncbi:hypothetical protein SDC9_36514 [bioreactor metagenome]|uniref:Uncharacterized protein n=1 Tax=bioreactor metagenome TaxID=1076179 RepID=A0A644VGE3_9ZZZZ